MRTLPLPSGLALLATLGTTLPAASQDQYEGPERPNLQHELTAWRSAHGPSWATSVDRATGYAEMLYGGTAPAPFVPATDAEWIEVARFHLATTLPFHGIEGTTLEASRAVFLPLGLGAGGTDKMTVNFRQAVNGVPVRMGFTNVLMNLDGGLLSVQSTASPHAAGMDTDANVTAPNAGLAAVRLFEAETGDAPTSTSSPTLVIEQLEGAGARLPRLAWEVDVLSEVPGFEPLGWTYWLDATTGALLRRETLIHHLDVGGTLTTMASPGTLPDKASNPDQALPMPYARVSSSAGITHTDADGNWNYPGVSGPLNVTFEYRGLYVNVDNQAGADYTLTVNGLTGTSNNVLMNPSGTNATVTAQANAHRGINRVRDYIRGVTAGDATADFVATANPNISSSCNAFFNGNSTNYYLAGGGCVNTAYSTVVSHEQGHWLNVLYGTGNGSDGMGEGNADVFAMFVDDTAIVGQDFCGTGCHVRTGTNNRQFCGDSNPGCHGGVHADGEVWMGAAWKIRERLDATHGNTMGDLIADTLFMGWMNGYNQSQIRSIIEIQWLTLDDNDGNINNGTPNYNDIDGGFRAQGFPGFDLPFVQFSNVTDLDDTIDETGPYVVFADIVAGLNPPIASAEVFYRVDGGSFSSVPMSNVGGNTFRGEIPGIVSPANVEYYLAGTDSAGQSDVFPDDAPGSTLSFRVGTVVTFLSTEFEEATNEGWVAGAAGDTATTGVWVRADPRGTGPQTEDDHTANPGVRCWFTGQGSSGGSVGENDVDGGATTLLSPVFDATGLTNPRISYWRWYSNQYTSANDDVFRISISNDGGSTWSSVENIGGGSAQANGGWYQYDFDVASVISLTNQMQLRFVASDTGQGSIVEAAIDDVEGYDLQSSCPQPLRYGDGKINSQLVTPEMQWTGKNSLASNDFVLGTTTLVAGQAAVLVRGSQAAEIPFFGGTLLVGGSLVREALVAMDAFGVATAAVPIDASMVDTTRYYQWWYRDPAHADGTGVGLSDAVEVTFCD